MALVCVRHHADVLKHRTETLLRALDYAIEEEDEEIRSLDIEDINKYFRLVEVQFNRLKRFIEPNK